jgi:hypothetical protein
MYAIRPEYLERANEYYREQAEQPGCEPGEYLASATLTELIYCWPGYEPGLDWWHVAVRMDGGWAHGIVLELEPGVYMHRSGAIERVEPERVMLIGCVTRIVDLQP